MYMYIHMYIHMYVCRSLFFFFFFSFAMVVSRVFLISNWARYQGPILFLFFFN